MRRDHGERSGVSRLAAFAGGALLLGLLPPEVSAQCAMCRDSAASAPVATREALNYAIIGLALTPYGVASAAAWFLSPKFREGVRSILRRAPFVLRRPSA